MMSAMVFSVADFSLGSRSATDYWTAEIREIGRKLSQTFTRRQVLRRPGSPGRGPSQADRAGEVFTFF
jgi:hypothetical protein